MTTPMTTTKTMTTTTTLTDLNLLNVTEKDTSPVIPAEANTQFVIYTSTANTGTSNNTLTHTTPTFSTVSPMSLLKDKTHTTTTHSNTINISNSGELDDQSLLMMNQNAHDKPKQINSSMLSDVTHVISNLADSYTRSKLQSNDDILLDLKLVNNLDAAVTSFDKSLGRQESRDGPKLLATTDVVSVCPRSERELAQYLDHNQLAACQPPPSPQGDLHPLDTELKMLLQKLPINNPFYRFHKQSASFRDSTTTGRSFAAETETSTGTAAAEMMATATNKTSFMCLAYNIRKFKSDTDLCKTNVNVKYINNSVVVVANNNKHGNHKLPKHLRTLNKTNQNLDFKLVNDKKDMSLLYPNHANTSNSSSSKPNDFNNSTVITNPFSIFHDDETQLTLTVDKRLRCASSASRRLAKKPLPLVAPVAAPSGPRPYMSHQQLTNYHHLYGVPIKRFERQDFPAHPDDLRKLKKAKMASSSSSSSVFKQISLRKTPRTCSASSSNLNQTTGVVAGPHLKKLKISYPDRTHTMATSVTSSSSSTATVATAASATANHKNTYFSKLQAKTRQGLQKLKDKCRQLNHASQLNRNHMNRNTSLNFKTMAKVESFRFISDKDHIRNYETKCMAAYQQDALHKQGTLYKSYKSELDLSKNLNYLEHYLQQNFDNKTTAQSVGRSQGQKLRRAFHQVSSSSNESGQHKRSQSTESPKKLNKNNYENVSNQGALTKTESLSSSDYASVFSVACGEESLVAKQLKTDSLKAGGSTQNGSVNGSGEANSTNLRYEHPKMCEYLLENKSPKLLRNHKSADTTLQLEVDDDEISYNEELIRICNNKEQLLYDEEFPNHLDAEIACNNIRILINNSEDFEDDWYLSRSETDNISEVAFYQSLNDHLQQELEEPLSTYDPFSYSKSMQSSYDSTQLSYDSKDLYPFVNETEMDAEDQCQLIAASSALAQRGEIGKHLTAQLPHQNKQQQRLKHGGRRTPFAYDPYESELEQTLQAKSYYGHHELIGGSHNGYAAMPNLYKPYQNPNPAKTSLSNSSSSTSSIHQQQLYHKYASGGGQHKTPSPCPYAGNPPTYNITASSGTSASTTSHPTGHIRRPSNASNTSSSDNFDSFIQIRSNKLPSNKRSSYYSHHQRSPNAVTATTPPINILNFYGSANVAASGTSTHVQTPTDSMPCYSVPHKMNSSSSSSNHSSKLSNSSSNSTTSSSHAATTLGTHLMAASLIGAATSAGAGTGAATSSSSASASAATNNSATMTQINLSKLYNNPITAAAAVNNIGNMGNISSSAAAAAASGGAAGTATTTPAASTHLSSSYPYEKRDKFILEYEC